jgi:hypothetical protein
MGEFISEDEHVIAVCKDKVSLPLNYAPRFAAGQQTFLSPQLLQRFVPNGLETIVMNADVGAGRDWTDNQLQYLVGINTLAELDLAKNQMITNSSLQYIDQLPALWRLDIGSTNINGQALTHLKALGRLKRLCVNDDMLMSPLFQFMAQRPNNYQLDCLIANNSGITDYDLFQISKLKTITELRLSGNKFTASGLEHLVNLPRLSILKIKDNALDATALKPLDKMKALKQLEVSDGIFTRGDRVAFGKKTPHCSVYVQKPRYGFSDP